LNEDIKLSTFFRSFDFFCKKNVPTAEGHGRPFVMETEQLFSFFDGHGDLSVRIVATENLIDGKQMKTTIRFGCS
jgi:hypothetical protein